MTRINNLYTNIFYNCKKYNAMKKAILNTARILLGVVFVFSGFVKAVDPLGGTYKFQDYFHAFGWEFFVPFAFTLAVLLAGLEFVTGIGLVFNFYPKFFTKIALLFMVVFTPLTLYIAINNPVTDCGCFGDAIKISNWATFYKNIVISALAIYLIINLKKLRGNKYSLHGVSLAVIFISFIMWYSYRHLPILDFRPYKVGNNIPELMKIPEGAPQDEYVYYYTLKNSKTGETKKMDSKQYIESQIWKDTTWQIIKTSDPVLVKEGYHPPVHDFVIESEDGNDITDVVLSADKYILVISYDISGFDKGSVGSLRKLVNNAKKNGVNIIFWTASNIGDAKEMLHNFDIDLPVYLGDEINLKTIVRSNPGIVLLKKGVVADKWSSVDIPQWSDIKKLLKK
jgi:uncharacterized membrane protein YphA (DoxX/SURF4 family)